MSPATRAKIERLKARARSAASGARGLAKGGKGSAIAAAVGAIAVEADIRGLKKMDFFADPEHWYAAPIAFAVAGHFLRRKHEAAGLGLLGAAGAMGASAYERKEGTEGAGIVRSIADAGRVQDAGQKWPDPGFRTHVLRGPVFAPRYLGMGGMGGIQPMVGEPVAVGDAGATASWGGGVHDAGRVQDAGFVMGVDY